MPEDPETPPTSDPPPIGGSGISKTVDDTATTDTMQGYTDPTATDTTTSGGDVTDTTSTDTTTNVMPESDPPPIGGSGV